MNLLKILQNRAQLNRSGYYQRQIETQKKSDRTQEQSAQVLGYNATTTLYQVQDAAGNIIYARCITNGAFGNGEYVSLVRPGAGGIPVIDSMPK